MHYKRSVFRSLAMVTQLGLCVLTPTLFAIFAGQYIDSRFGTKTMLVLLILGVLGGGRGAYLMAKRLIERDAREERAERERKMREAMQGPQAAVSRPKTPSRIYGASVTGSDGGERGGRAAELTATGIAGTADSRQSTALELAPDSHKAAARTAADPGGGEESARTEEIPGAAHSRAGSATAQQKEAPR